MLKSKKGEEIISPTATIPMIEESVEADQAEAARTEAPKGSKDFSSEERATIIAMAKCKSSPRIWH